MRFPVMRVGTLALVTLAAFSPPSAAQPGPVPAGRTVRIVRAAGAPIHRGTLLLAVGDTVWLGNSQHNQSFVLGPGDRLEVMTARHALTIPGALVGAAAGAAIGSTMQRHMCANGAYVAGVPTTYCGLTSAQGALLLGAAGLGVGALVGSRLGPTRWEAVGPAGQAPMQVTISPAANGGLALGVSLALHRLRR